MLHTLRSRKEKDSNVAGVHRFRPRARPETVTVAYQGIEGPILSQRCRRGGRGRGPSGDRDRGRVQRDNVIEHAAGLRPFTRYFGTYSSKAGKQTRDDATDVFRS